jgi:hypothetical protein
MDHPTNDPIPTCSKGSEYQLEIEEKSFTPNNDEAMMTIKDS